MTTRMADNPNTTVLTKILDFTTHVFSLLKDRDYKLHDSEASVFVPWLVEKTIGHNTQKFRTSTRTLFALMCHTYAPSKVFNYLMDGVEKAKNLKARAECLDECTLMITKIGLGVCPYKKLIPSVGKLVGSADAGIRDKALAFLAAIYSLIGEEVWTHLGGKDKCKLGNKEKGLVEQRFKNTTISERKAPEPAAAASAAMSTTALVGGKAVSGKGASPAKPATAAGVRPTTAPGPAAAADESESEPVAAAVAAPIPAQATSGVRPPLQVNRMMMPDVDASTMKLFSLDLDAIGMGMGTGSMSSTTVAAPTITHSAAPSGIPMAAESSRPSGIPGAAALMAAARPTTAPVSGLSRLRPPTSVSALSSGVAPLTATAAAVQVPAPVAAPAPVYSSFNDRMNRVIFHALESSVEDERIDAMKEIWSGIAEKGAQIVQPHTDKVVGSLLAQIMWSFTEEASTITAASIAAGIGAAVPDVFTGQLSVRHRLAKYALNTLMEIFKKPGLAAEVHLSTLDKLIIELLGRLVDPRLKRLDDGNSLIKALDVLMLKVLENGDRTSSFIVLLNALRTRVPKACQPGSVRTKALVDLVMKCAVKVTKAISLTIEQLNLTLILNAMHQYLVASADFAPAPLCDEALKIVRTILSEFVRLKGAGLRAYMLELPTDSRLIAYFTQMHEYNSKVDRAIGSGGAGSAGVTNTSAASTASVLPPAVKVPVVGRPVSGSSTGSGPNSAASTPRGETKQHYRPSDLGAAAAAGAAGAGSSDGVDKENERTSVVSGGSNPFGAELDSIFRRLLKTDTTAGALKELYAFMNAHPNVDVQPYILRTSTPFQGYIERGLKSIRLAAENNLQTPAKPKSQPAATAAPTIASSAAGSADGSTSPGGYRARLKELQARAGMLGTSAPASVLSSSISSATVKPALQVPSVPPQVAAAPAPAPAPTVASKTASRLPVRASIGAAGLAAPLPAGGAAPAPAPAGGAKPLVDIKARLASIRAGSSAMSPPRA